MANKALRFPILQSDRNLALFDHTEYLAGLRAELPAPPHQELCRECGEYGLTYQNGCAMCVFCGWSACD